MSRSEATKLAWTVYTELFNPTTSAAIAEGYNIREKLIQRLCEDSL